jgi:NTE family protein
MRNHNWCLCKPRSKIEAKDFHKAVTSRAFDILSANSSAEIQYLRWVIEPKELTLYSTFEMNKLKMDAILISDMRQRKSYEKLNL